MAQGACLCGVVRYEVDGPYRWFSHCHCSMCRKHHGTFHSTVLAAEKSNFRFLQGEDAVVHYCSSPGLDRPFCKHCGSKVPGVVADFVAIPAGTLEDEVGVQPQVHIFVGDKSPLESITDSLAQFAAYPEGYGTAVPGPVNENAASPGIHGSCLCGSVKFAIDRKPNTVVQCHCSRCQRSRGTAHGVNTFVPQDALRFVRGVDGTFAYNLPTAKSFGTVFCRQCGSQMPRLLAGLGMYLVPVGSLDTAFEVKATLHIYVGSKAKWFSITDNYPQFDEMPPREQIREALFN